MRYFLSNLLLADLVVLCSHQTITQTANFQQAKQFIMKKMLNVVESISVQPYWIEKQDRFWYSYKTPEGKNW